MSETLPELMKETVQITRGALLDLIALIQRHPTPNGYGNVEELTTLLNGFSPWTQGAEPWRLNFYERDGVIDTIEQVPLGDV